MTPQVIDLTGQRFGQWTILQLSPVRQHRKAQWECVCDCGTEATVESRSLRTGNSTGCGCTRKYFKIHGMTETSEHGIWRSMIARCTNPKSKGYPRYGARGIKVCARWLESFENFYIDMGQRPDNLTVERIDNNGNYEPGNCRWATRKEQVLNNSNSRIWTVDGVAYDGSEAAAIACGVSRAVIYRWCNGHHSCGIDYPPKNGCSSAPKYGDSA